MSIFTQQWFSNREQVGDSDDGRSSSIIVLSRPPSQHQEYPMRDLYNRDSSRADDWTDRRAARIEHRAAIVFSMRYFTFAARVKAMALFVICAVFLYLYAESSATSNWESTRAVGFSQPGMCLLPESGTKYIVSQATSSYGGKLAVPLVYAVNPGGGWAPCMTPKTLAMCFSNVFSVPPYNELDMAVSKALFAPAPGRLYFPYGIWIMLLSTLALFVSQIYERRARLFVPANVANALSDRFQSRMMSRANYVVCFVTVGLLVVSATTFNVVFDEDCNLQFRPIPNNPDLQEARTFCNGVAGCGTVITSVINPSNFVTDNYTTLVLLVGMVLFASTLIQYTLYFLSPTDDPFLTMPSEHYADSSFRSSMRSHAHRANDQVARVRAERLAAGWTVVPAAEWQAPDAVQFDDQCSICMTDLCPDRARLKRKPLSRSIRIALSATASHAEGLLDMMSNLSVRMKPGGYGGGPAHSHDVSRITTPRVSTRTSALAVAPGSLDHPFTVTHTHANDTSARAGDPPSARLAPGGDAAAPKDTTAAALSPRVPVPRMGRVALPPLALPASSRPAAQASTPSSAVEGCADDAIIADVPPPLSPNCDSNAALAAVAASAAAAAATSTSGVGGGGGGGIGGGSQLSTAFGDVEGAYGDAHFSSAMSAMGSRPGSVFSSPRAGPPTDAVVVKVPCGHYFHRSCLTEWAMASNVCPLCRSQLG